ncbi:MAG TPA: mersacidin/lichenicidin family type 2 lantibiotic [Myxococcaceae bacterium]|jgi:mersacidin/lichenicidin family type 2 lantibiotic
MKRETIVRAWKDPEFRAGLTSEERSALPECPAGTAFTDLDEQELADAVGGAFYLEGIDGCICSDWTMPVTTTRTFTTTRLNDTLRFDPVVLDKTAVLTKQF